MHHDKRSCSICRKRSRSAAVVTTNESTGKAVFSLREAAREKAAHELYEANERKRSANFTQRKLDESRALRLNAYANARVSVKQIDRLIKASK